MKDEVERLAEVLDNARSQLDRIRIKKPDQWHRIGVSEPIEFQLSEVVAHMFRTHARAGVGGSDTIVTLVFRGGGQLEFWLSNPREIEDLQRALAQSLNKDES